MKVIYWAPYMGNVGTIKAVINSARAIKKYHTQAKVAIIKAYSEWEGYEKEIIDNDIEIIDFKLKSVLPKLPKYNIGFRISMLLISLLSIPKLTKLLNREKPDMFISNLLTVPAILGHVRAKHKTNFVASIQGFPKFMQEKPKGYPFWMKIEDTLRKYIWKWLYSKVDYAIVLSPDTQKKMERVFHFLKNKMVFIPNPIAEESMEEKSKECIEHQWFKKKKCPVILAVGRLSKQKDFPTLLRAFAKARNTIEAKLVIIGKGEEKKYLEVLAKKLQIENDLWMAGFVDNPYKYFAQADLFIQTSLFEDPGHALIEAGYLKVPIISTKCPSNAEEFLVFGKGGHLAEIGDYNAISSQIIHILKENHSEKIKNQIAYARKSSEKYSLYSHYLDIKKLMK